MIIPASQRGNAKQLAVHLSNLSMNDHVELYEVRGLFHDQSIQEALREMHALSKGSRCQKHLFSLSVDPVHGLDHDGKLYDEIFQGLDERFPMLKDQPRLIVFHEKEGRRHAHVVYSRINRDGKAIELGLYKKALTSFSHDLFEKHAPEQMPKNLQSWAKRQSEQRLKENQTRAELERERRTKQSREAHHQILKEAVTEHDTLDSLRDYLKERGYHLCNGNRSLLAYDTHTKEAYALTRATGMKVQELKQRYAGHADLPSMDKVKSLLVNENDHIQKADKPVKELANQQDSFEKHLQERQQKIQTQREHYRKQRDELEKRQQAEKTKIEFTLRSQHVEEEQYRQQKQEIINKHYSEKHDLIQDNLKQRRALDKAYKVSSVKEQQAKHYAFSRGLKEWKGKNGKAQTSNEYQFLNSLAEGFKNRDNAKLKQNRETLWQQQQKERRILNAVHNKEVNQFWQNVKERNRTDHKRRESEICQADHNVAKEEQQYKQRIKVRKSLTKQSLEEAPQISKLFKVHHDRGHIQTSHETQIKSSQAAVERRHRILKAEHAQKHQKMIQSQSEQRVIQRESQSIHRRDRAVQQREGMLEKGEHVKHFQEAAKPPQGMISQENIHKPSDTPLEPFNRAKRHPKPKPL